MNIVLISIWIVLILLAIGVAAMVLFGIMAMANGKVRMSSLLTAVLTLAVFGIAYLTSVGAADTMVLASVRTVIILLVIGFLSLLVTGVRRVVI